MDRKRKFVTGEVIDLSSDNINFKKNAMPANRALSTEEQSLAISQANTDTSASHDLKGPKLAPTDLLRLAPVVFKSIARTVQSDIKAACAEKVTSSHTSYDTAETYS